MKTNTATDNLQSKRLLRCGVPADTADMFYQTPITVLQKGTREDLLLVRTADKTLFNTDIPAWSLSALLRLIPHIIKAYDDGDYYFSLAQEFPASEDYHAAYKYCWADDDVLVGKRNSCPIEACVQLIEWLSENNYNLKKL